MKYHFFISIYYYNHKLINDLIVQRGLNLYQNSTAEMMKIMKIETIEIIFEKSQKINK